MKRARFAALAFVLMSTADASSQMERAKDFGRQWIRSHPFTLMAPTVRGEAVKNNDWIAEGGFNTVFVWKHRLPIYEAAIRQDLPYHCHVNKVRVTPDGIHADEWSKLTSLLEIYADAAGVLVYDEPKLPDFLRAGKAVAEIKRKFPNALVYSNANPISPLKAHGYSSPDRAGTEYLGNGIYDDTPVPYTYDDFLDDFARIIKPDVLMADVYPFWVPEKLDPKWYLKNKYFLMLAALRKAGLKHHLPYWIFVQAYESTGRCRLPSESDVRMQVYSSLAFGFTGIAYFTYDWGRDEDRSLLDHKFLRTRLYHDVTKLNSEVSNIGKTLRFLTSTDVRYVLAEGVKGGGSLLLAPKGLSPFYHKSRVAKLLREITVRDAVRGQDGLVGFFEDDRGGQYFMIVNLRHGEDVSADQATMALTLQIAPSVTKVGRLSRATGEPELLIPENGRIQIALPGGTGDLFKFGDADFVGLDQPLRAQPFKTK